MFIYGRDNLWLVRKKFSLDRFNLFIPPLGVLGFFTGIILSFFFPLIRSLFLVIVGIYLLGFFVASIKENIKTTFWVFVVSAITPFVHGFGSLYGLFKKQEKK